MNSVLLSDSKADKPDRGRYSLSTESNSRAGESRLLSATGCVDTADSLVQKLVVDRTYLLHSDIEPERPLNRASVHRGQTLPCSESTTRLRKPAATVPCAGGATFGN